jgi:hypothetical protein
VRLLDRYVNARNSVLAETLVKQTVVEGPREVAMVPEIPMMGSAREGKGHLR